MIPGYLHLECRRGLRVDLLNAALASLLADHTPVNKALAGFGIGLRFLVTPKTVSSTKGHGLELYLDDAPFAKAELAHVKHVFGTTSAVSLIFIEQWLAQLPFTPSVHALGRKIFQHLTATNFSEHNVDVRDALWLAANIVLFGALVDSLDPKFITVTKLCVGQRQRSTGDKNLSLTDSSWLNQVLINVPVIEVDDVVDIDVIAVACVKALASHLGARGESRIHRIGVGIDDGPSLLLPVVVEALWCETRLPDSMTEHGFAKHARIDSLHQISGTLHASVDVTELASAMSLHGAMSVSWHLASREKNASCYVMRFFVRDEDKRDAIEAFLIKGGAFEVVSAVVERQELCKRLVNVPIGTGNKASTARFFEYVYLDKTVRVEPVKEDLDHYVQKTDYSVDVARSDLMLAWKKWRGRVVSEDT